MKENIKISFYLKNCLYFKLDFYKKMKNRLISVLIND